ncbi:radical SAM family heme chaperone HemW [Inconstantimicrobium mannanitabidum]|uniref:Coproporphyrinogen III oxidase n=1 Tax=Inconstantimicrobium mannanitabidum TaxID=1604901 RepID=A0ACB5R8Q8_9CLOT|nr:radical SAM family heme chaperone HemW [Clostridium sp. TW13]GKX65565.1 coproporphyrinogen III oxidase [Clostridium sp. TW13]
MKEISLYIHIPFCKNKCMYCDFPSFSGKDNLKQRYVDALCKEIELKASKYKIKTIFIGGGTPTYLSIQELNNLFASINKLAFAEDLEFTVECNPGTLSEEKLLLMKTAGVNRLSIGLQATQNTLLKTIGRIHNFKEFEENFLLARKVGFKNINVDLMFALPDQSVQDWEETLNKVTELNPEHISAYSLIIEEGTPFCKLYNEDKLNLPSEDEERLMYSKTIEFLKFKNYNQYEISNFAKEGKQCRHNIVYWRLEEYLGCGSSAAGYIDGIRYKNKEIIEEYIESIERNVEALEEKVENSLEDTMEEFIFMGLRMIEGINEEKFFDKFKVKIDDVYLDVINKHINEGLLIRKDNTLALTPKGIEFSNYVMSDFILTCE